MEAPIRVVAYIIARSGKEDEVKSILSSIVQPTHQQPGCLHYELLQNNDDATEFALFEEWETQAALDRQRAAAHMKTAKSKVKRLIAASPDVRFYQTIA